jgi:hypothetical protein
MQLVLKDFRLSEVELLHLFLTTGAGEGKTLSSIGRAITKLKEGPPPGQEDLAWACDLARHGKHQPNLDRGTKPLHIDRMTLVWLERLGMVASWVNKEDGLTYWKITNFGIETWKSEGVQEMVSWWTIRAMTREVASA